MTHPEEQGIEMERRAAEFEKLLEQVDRLSTAQEKKTRPENDAEKETPKA
jgi:hypothetical protein